MDGWLNLYKPAGVSSGKYLNGLKRLLGKEIKLGHAGTLDPLAEGLLPVALGQATRLIPWAQLGFKLYDFEITWGYSTDSYDEDGRIVAVSDVRPDPECVRAAVAELAVRTEQIPPVYSALKFQGRRLCDLKREGADVPLPVARPAKIHRLHCLRADERGARFLVWCGKGFYVRSLARDICAHTGAEGRVTRLVRLACGKFSADSAFSVAEGREKAYKLVLKSRLLPPDFVLDGIPVRYSGEEEATMLRAGRSVLIRSAASARADEPEPPEESRREDFGPGVPGLTAVYSSGSLVALATERDGSLRPKRVFHPFNT